MEQQPQPVLSPETAQQFADTRAACSAAIEALLADGQANISSIRAIIVSGKCATAARAKDMGAFDSHFDELLATPELDVKELVSACLDGIAAGSERAYDTLDSIISGERQSTLRQIKTGPEIFTVDPLYAYDSGTGLVNLFEVCANTATPPDAWIDRAAANPMHRWALFMEYYQHVASSKEAPQPPTLQHEIDRTAAALLENPAFTGPFLLAAITKALTMTQDPALHSALFNKLLGEIGENTSATAALDLRWFSGALTTYINRQPRPASDQGYDTHVLKAHDILDILADRIDEAGGDTYTLGHYLNIQAAFTKYSARSAENIIESLNAYTDELGKTRINADDLYTLRDVTLGQYAVFAAEAGDFQAARALIAAMHEDRRKADVLTDCYALAKQPADLEALHADGLLIDPTTHPDTFRLAAEARVSNNPASIAEAMTILAMEGRANGTSRAYAYDFYIQLLDLNPGLAASTAKEIQAQLRLRDTESYYFSELSFALIRSGDSAEAAAAYAQIMDNLSSQKRLFYLSRLQETIDWHFPGLRQRTISGPPGDSSEGQDPVTRGIIALLRTMEK